MKKINFKKGATFLEFSVCIVFLMLLLIIVLSIFIRRYISEKCDLYADTMARGIVVCESMDDANLYISSHQDLFDYDYIEDVTITIDYLIGSEQEWKKGNYISITYICKIDSVFGGISEYTITITRMIENEG